MERAQKEFNESILKIPRRFTQIFHSTNSFGDVVSGSKNVKNCFVLKDSENCRYCDFGSKDKDSYDLVMS